MASSSIIQALLLLGSISLGSAHESGAQDLSKMVADLDSLIRSQRSEIVAMEREDGAQDRRLDTASNEWLVQNVEDHWFKTKRETGSAIPWMKDRASRVANRPSVSTVGLDSDSIFLKTKAPYVQDQHRTFQIALSHAWVILCGTLVLFMQAGFTLMQAGSCHEIRAVQIMVKNLAGVCIGTMAWYIFGYGFALSGPFNSDQHKENGFIGSDSFAGHRFSISRSDGQQEPTDNIVVWFFQWAFCVVAATIVNGGIAERLNFRAFLVISIFMSSFIYPVVVAWTWGGGWLDSMNDAGFFDFSGSGIVHLTGGTAALIGAAFAGPRPGRFTGMTSAKARITEVPETFVPHSLPLVVLGTFILWFGWYGFNCGATLGMKDGVTGMLAGTVAMNTTIAASVGGLVAFSVRMFVVKKPDLVAFCNGILAGLVSISACCGNIENGTAVLVGFVGGLIYLGASALLKILQIDDPVDAFAVHGACGAWGTLAAALFDMGKDDSWHGWSGFKCNINKETGDCATDLSGAGVAANIAEIFAIIAWVSLWSVILFGILKALGWLNPTDEEDYLPPTLRKKAVVEEAPGTSI